MTPQTGTVYILEGCLVFAAERLINELFTDYPISVILGVDEDVVLDFGDSSEQNRGFVVQHGIKRRLESPGRVVDLLISLDSDYYHYIVDHLATDEVLPLSAERLEAIRPLLAQLVDNKMAVDGVTSSVDNIVAKLLTELFGTPSAQSPLDARLVPVINYLQKELPINPPIENLAAMAGLSQSRLMHLFKQQLGLPIRQYLLWKKLEAAARLVAKGTTLIDVAAETGFYDQAHFTRTVRRMLDLPPSAFTDSRNVQVIEA